jgi:predicted ribosome quality control (RQC) complex YloA/Tae2 family protein
MDTFLISALVDELNDAIAGGRIQDVIDVDTMGIGLEIYANRRRRYLYLSADPHQPRLHLIDAKLRRGLPKPTQLGLLMRTCIEGAIVGAISQPPWERLLEIETVSGDAKYRIIAELMPRRANILLVHNGKILDCLNRVGPAENRYRLSLPNHEYVPPPPICGQLDPAHVTECDLRRLLASAEKPSAQTRRLLPGRILGLSPLLAKEIVFRASGAIDTKAMNTDSAALYAAFNNALTPLLQRRWQPGIGRIAGAPAAYSVYPLSQMEWRATDTVSAATQGYFGAISGTDAYQEAKKPVQAAIQEARIKLQSKIQSLSKGLRDDSELQRLKQSGDLILAYQFSLVEGQRELHAQYNPDEPALQVTLDPERSPLENAQNYFRRYEKAKSANEAVPALINETRLELEFVAQLENDLATASNWPEIDDVMQILQMRGHWQGARLRKIGGGRQGPLRIVSRDGYVIWLGRNSRQNEKVTFKTAKAQDIWLHARDVPGAHVIIRNDGRRISEQLIEEAAAVAAWYSTRRSDASVSVDYTRVKYVKAIKGAGPGMVNYRNESSLLVQPQDESILK